MFVEHIDISGFRCIEQATLELAPGINLIVGDNASGKTSCLESLYILGRGESFRQATLKQAIRRGTNGFTLRARLARNDRPPLRLAAHRSPGAIQFKRDDEDELTRLDLVQTLPLQHIDPNVHRLLEEGPKYRRQFMDWGVFHVEHAFFPAWRRYRRALRQRNRALRERQARHNLIAWDAEIVRQGELVDACRRRYIAQIDALLPDSARRLLGDEPVNMVYESGWRGEDGLGAALVTSLEQDVRAGFTHQGPHRADLRINVESSKARDWVSRGQQKLLTTALMIVQAQILFQHRGIRPLLLVDDLAAELGTRYRETVAAELSALGGQCVMTFLDPSAVPHCLAGARMFHVEHGIVMRSSQ